MTSRPESSVFPACSALRRLAIALVCGVLVLWLPNVQGAIGGGTSSGSDRGSPQSVSYELRYMAWLASVTDGFPPPPAHLRPYLRHFVHLSMSYNAVAADSKSPFAVWLVMHGVTDPVMHRAMMALYQWVQMASVRDSN